MNEMQLSDEVRSSRVMVLAGLPVTGLPKQSSSLDLTLLVKNESKSEFKAA